MGNRDERGHTKGRTRRRTDNVRLQITRVGGPVNGDLLPLINCSQSVLRVLKSSDPTIPRLSEGGA